MRRDAFAYQDQQYTEPVHRHRARSVNFPGNVFVYGTRGQSWWGYA